MTTAHETRPTEVDPLVLTRRAGAGQHVLALLVDVIMPLAVAVIAVAALIAGLAAIGWMLLLAVVAAVAASLASLGRTGRSLGSLAAGTRTVDRTTGAAAGSGLVARFFSGRLQTFDLQRGRDPFAPALSPFEFPEAEPVPVATIGALRGRTPTLELDSGQRLTLESAIVIGRDPSTHPEAPAHLYQWPDLSRTLSKSHARLEWDGRTVWVTDLGSTNGTLLQVSGAAQSLLPFQRTPLPAESVLALGDREITVRSAA